MASRTHNSIRNSLAGTAVQAVTLVVNFIVRTALVYGLGKYYLGLNSVMTSLLAVFSLAELGVGNALVYSMYRPLAEGDTRKLEAYLSVFKKAYRIIGFVIALLAIALTPALPTIVNSPITEEVYVIYALFTANTVVSYLAFAYRGSLLQANQEKYLVSLTDLSFAAISGVGQIVSFVVFGNYIAGLVTLVCAQIIRNLMLFAITRKRFNEVDFSSREKLGAEERKALWRNVYSLAVGKFSDTANSSLANVVISAGVGLVETGLYSNYQMIASAIRSLMAQFFGSITASVGNLNVEADDDAKMRVYEEVGLLAAWVYTTISAVVWASADSFVEAWVGSEYLLPRVCLAGIVADILTIGFLHSTVIFKDGCGVFYQGRYRPVVSCILTVGLSLMLVGPFGIAGVIWAAPVSRALTASWYDPWIVHRYALMRSPMRYYLTTLAYCVIAFVSLIAAWYVCSLLPLSGWLKFLVDVFTAIVVSQVVLTLALFKSPHFGFLVSTIQKLIPVGRRHKK